MGVLAAQRFAKAAARLRSQCPQPAKPSEWLLEVDNAVQAHAAYLVIDLNDIWANFCRSMILDNALGKALDSSGAPIIPTHTLAGEAAILAAIKTKRGFEPKWHNAIEAVRAESKCSTNKSAQIQTSLGALSSPAPFINTARNYFAHRRSDCRQKLEAESGYRSPMKFNAYKIGNYLRSDGRTNIEFWTDELIGIAYASVA